MPNLICVLCGEFFEVSPSLQGSRKYCSRECYDAARKAGNEIKSCEFCGEDIESTPSAPRKYCSRECYHSHQKSAVKSNGHGGNGESPDDCHHLPEYENENGDCLRCDIAQFARDDQRTKRELTADAYSGGTA